MAHVRDQWFRPSPGGRVRTARHGVGRRWLASHQDASGRRHAKSFDRRVDAERYVAQMAADVARGAFVDPMLGRTKFGGYAWDWLAAQTFDVSTHEQVEHRLRRYLCPTWEDVPLARIRASTVQKWLAELTQRLSPATVRQAFVTFSAILSAAVDDEMIAKNPTPPANTAGLHVDCGCIVRCDLSSWVRGRFRRLARGCAGDRRPSCTSRP